MLQYKFIFSNTVIPFPMIWFSSPAYGFLSGFILLSQLRCVASEIIRINEVSGRGTSGACNGNDLIELYLPSTSVSTLDLDGYILYDENEDDSGNAFTFPTNTSTRFSRLSPGDYLLLCNKGPNPLASPPFGIGKSAR